MSKCICPGPVLWTVTWEAAETSKYEPELSDHSTRPCVPVTTVSPAESLTPARRRCGSATSGLRYQTSPSTRETTPEPSDKSWYRSPDVAEPQRLRAGV